MAAERVRTFLEGAGVAFTVERHDRAVDAQRLAEQEHVSGWMIAKPVLLKTADDDLVMMVIPGPAQVDLDRAEAIVGAPVRLASEEEFAPVFEDCEAGAEPPMGHLYGIEVHVDPILEEDDELVFRAGTHDTAIRMAARDYLAIVHQVDAPVAVLPD